MFSSGYYTKTAYEQREDEIYAKAGRKMLNPGEPWGSFYQIEFQKSLDRHSAAMERLTAVLENQKPASKRRGDKRETK